MIGTVVYGMEVMDGMERSGELSGEVKGLLCGPMKRGGPLFKVNY